MRGVEVSSEKAVASSNPPTGTPATTSYGCILVRRSDWASATSWLISLAATRSAVGLLMSSLGLTKTGEFTVLPPRVKSPKLTAPSSYIARASHRLSSAWSLCIMRVSRPPWGIVPVRRTSATRPIRRSSPDSRAASARSSEGSTAPRIIAHTVACRHDLYDSGYAPPSLDIFAYGAPVWIVGSSLPGTYPGGIGGVYPGGGGVAGMYSVGGMGEP